MLCLCLLLTLCLTVSIETPDSEVRTFLASRQQQHCSGQAQPRTQSPADLSVIVTQQSWPTASTSFAVTLNHVNDAFRSNEEENSVYLGRIS